MGKQVKVVSNDPILSKNFKYEKRSKNKLIEKALNEEQKALELKKKKQLLEVEKKVDQRIEQMTSSLAHYTQQNKTKSIKEQMFQSAASKPTNKNLSNHIQKIVLTSSTNAVDLYNYHFGLTAKQDELVREKRVNKKQQIQAETRKQIKTMFYGGNQPIEEQQENVKEGKEGNDQIYNLSVEAKRQTQLFIDSQLFHVSKNFNLHRNLLAKNVEEGSDQSLNSAKTLINSYFDHVYVQNSQQQKIQAFREIVIVHSLTHLNRCQQAQKGKGFTNCKILILTPFMGDAKSIIELIEQKYPEYEIKNKEKLESIQDQNDFFRIGLKFAKKRKQLTYFSSFDHSEIIIASPVGLKSIIGSQGDQQRENSFISSVQILYIDRASVLLMQNWNHILEVLKNINIMPRYQSLKNSIDTIRESFLDLKARLFRQSIVFTQFNFPELNALKNCYFHNLQGLATSKVHHEKLSLESKAEQNFYKIELLAAKDDLQTRFEYFKRKFWDDLHNKQSMSKVVLFTNSYFEYVKLKAFLDKVNASFQYVCEHTSKNKVQSRLARFNNGQYRILLTTERAFYFEVCQVKKFSSVYFYSLPKNSFIYQELVSNVQVSEVEMNKVVAVYTKFDTMLLERIVGTNKALQMVRDYCNNVSFVIS